MKRRWSPSDWTTRHAWRIVACWLAALAAGIAADVRFVTLGRPTISERSWAVCSEHPVAVIGGLFMAAGIAWTVRKIWPVVFLAGVLAGHLLAHG